MASAESTVDCTFSLAPAAEVEPILLTNVASAQSITTRLGAAGSDDTVRITAVYRNNRDQALTGLTLRVPAPSGADIAPAGEGGTAEQDGVTWALPDLAPDEVALFEFGVRLLSAASVEIALTPQMTGDQLEGPVLGDPISLQVVQ
jgi:hypothetical protein